MNAKILLVANTGWYLHNFQGNLARRLKESGATVIAVCPFDEYVERLQSLGLEWIEWRVDRASMNPFKELWAVAQLMRIYRAERPTIVHHFTGKSVLYGTVSAKCAHTGGIVNTVTGLGHVFVSDRWTMRVVRRLIRRWYGLTLTANGAQTLFQNRDDLAVLARSSKELAERAILVNGSGVDLVRFAPRNGHASHTPAAKKRVLFAGRLIEDKGIFEFIEAARLCHKNGADVRFVVCGKPDEGNPSSVDVDIWRQWQTEGIVECPGHVDRIEEAIGLADIVVLPSYREGTPRILLEAAAMAKPIITTDVPGCRDVVTHRENGVLVPPRNSAALAGAIQDLLTDEEACHRMGTEGRRRMVEGFDQQKVIDTTISVYEGLLASNPPSPRRNGRHHQPGAFTISLDFELAWGTRGRPSSREVPPFLDGTRHATDGLLELFEKYDVSATWAIVGALLLGDKSGRRHPWLDDPSLGDVPVGDHATQPHWYADDVIQAVRSCSVLQEIGCHTLTHQWVDPTSAGRDAFERDIVRCLELFENCSLPRPETFIYPKAHIGHFDVLAKHGFRAFRGPENKWFEAIPGQLASAACRLVDARLACRPVVDRPRQVLDRLWMIPSSQFYSPFMSVGRRVSVAARVRKAIKGLRLAAETGRVFHLWTHPYNLGVRTPELLGGLEEILLEASKLRRAGRLKILPMATLVDHLELGRVLKDSHALHREPVLVHDSGR